MVSIIGRKLQSNALISGFGYHHPHRVHHYGVRRTRHTTGRGIARRAIGSILGTLGHALVNRLSGAVSGAGRRRHHVRRRRVYSGSSFRLTGSGYRRRPVRRIGRPRTHYVRRVGRPRTHYVRRTYVRRTRAPRSRIHRRRIHHVLF